MHWGEEEIPSDSRLHRTRCQTDLQCRNQSVDCVVVAGADCGIVVGIIVAVAVVGAVVGETDEEACGFAA